MEILDIAEQYEVLSRSIVTSEEQADEYGRISACFVVREILHSHDLSLLKVTGTLDYDKVLLEHYQLNVTGKITVNEQLNLKSVIALREEVLSIAVYVKAHKKNEEVASARFRYRLF